MSTENLPNEAFRIRTRPAGERPGRPSNEWFVVRAGCLETRQISTTQDEPSVERGRWGTVTRRSFLLGGAAVGSSAASAAAALRLGGIRLDLRGLLDGIDGPDDVDVLGPVVDPIAGGIFDLFAPSHAIDLRRRVDMLDLRLEFFNLAPSADDPSVLTKVTPGSPAVMVAVLPPQSVGEHTPTLLTIGDGVPDPDSEIKDSPQPPLGAILSGPSRIAFEIPDFRLPLPLQIDTLLDWARYPMHNAPAASKSLVARSDLREPTNRETAIELPWRLQLSPWQRQLPIPGFSPIHWETQLTPGHRTTAPLWHARLRPERSPLVGGGGMRARAIWSRDFGNSDARVLTEEKNFTDPDGDDSAQDTVVIPLNPQERSELVMRTTVEQPQPIIVDELAVSTLGSWYDGTWSSPGPPPDGYQLREWQQTTTMGRDQYVRIVEEGHLMPFGHAAVRIEVSERAPAEAPDGRRYAYLFRREYLVIQEADLRFADPSRAPGQAWAGREFPFTRVRCLTPQSPLFFATPVQAPGSPIDTNDACVPVTAEGPWRPTFVCTDRRGVDHELDTTVAWVAKPVARGETSASFDILDNLILGTNQDGFAIDLDADLAFSTESGAEAGSATFPTRSLTLGLAHLTGPLGEVRELGRAAFYPVLLEADIAIPAVERLTRASADTPVGYAGVYLRGGVPGDAGDEPNTAELVLRTGGKDGPAPGPRLQLSSGSDRSGGVAAPDFRVALLSRSRGAIGHEPKTPEGDPIPTTPGDVDIATFDPTSFLDTSAAFLGGVSLVDILETGGPLDRMPETKVVEHPDHIETRLHWTPAVKNPDVGPVVLTDDSSLELTVTTIIPRDGTPARTTIVGEARKIQLQVLDRTTRFATVHLERVRFSEQPGGKRDFDPQIGEIEFHRELAFLETLATLLPFGGGDGVTVRANANGIGVGIDFPIPAFEIGVFTLKNIRFGAELFLPFTGGEAAISFEVGSRERPVTVTVMGFSGGAWFGLTATPSSAQLDVGAEFGGQVGLNLVVASGSIDVKAGVYFQVVVDDAGATYVFEAYLRVNGEVTVLEVVSARMSMVVSLQYLPKGGNRPNHKFKATATMVVEVECLVVSGSVEVSYSKEFSSGPGDPVFGEVITRDDWNDYVDAFAAIAV